MKFPFFLAGEESGMKVSWLLLRILVSKARTRLFPVDDPTQATAYQAASQS
jgi:hypothetical protein